ncbi:MAG: response regulator [Candidatus Zixiibacteriota bacterium]
MADVNVQELERRAQQRGQPFRVLIVDDEVRVREVLRDFCRLTQALDVELASNGTEAVEKMKARTYDLVTMDLIMPEMSGLDALTAIKQVSPATPVIVITGNATEKLVNAAGVQGASRVMYKPVMLDDFVAELTSMLAK